MQINYFRPQGDYLRCNCYFPAWLCCYLFWCNYTSTGVYLLIFCLFGWENRNHFPNSRVLQALGTRNWVLVTLLGPHDWPSTVPCTRRCSVNVCCFESSFIDQLSLVKMLSLHQNPSSKVLNALSSFETVNLHDEILEYFTMLLDGKGCLMFSVLAWILTLGHWSYTQISWLTPILTLIPVLSMKNISSIYLIGFSIHGHSCWCLVLCPDPLPGL